VLDNRANFKQFSNAFAVLFRVLLGEFVDMRTDCIIKEPHCTEPYDCGSYFATPYFVTFTVFSTFVTLNMVVAVVMDNFTWTYSLERIGGPSQEGGDFDEQVGTIEVGGVRIAVDDHIIVSSDDLQAYKDAWQQFDEHFTGRIRMMQVAHVLDAMAQMAKGDGQDEWVLGRSFHWQQDHPEFMHTLHNELMSIPDTDPEFVAFDELFLAIAYLHLEAEIAREQAAQDATEDEAGRAEAKTPLPAAFIAKLQG